MGKNLFGGIGFAVFGIVYCFFQASLQISKKSAHGVLPSIIAGSCDKKESSTTKLTMTEMMATLEQC